MGEKNHCERRHRGVFFKGPVNARGKSLFSRSSGARCDEGRPSCFPGASVGHTPSVKTPAPSTAVWISRPCVWGIPLIFLAKAAVEHWLISQFQKSSHLLSEAKRALCGVGWQRPINGPWDRIPAEIWKCRSLETGERRETPNGGKVEHFRMGQRGWQEMGDRQGVW